MDLHQYDIFEQCTQDDPITEMLGQATGHCSGRPNTANPLYVPVYVPKLVIPEPNCDPRRYEGYCKPVRVLSQPLSNEEYLRKKLLNGGRPLSKSYLLQTPASLGQYRTTLWTAAGTSYQPSTAFGQDLGLPLVTAPPVTGTLGTAIDSGLLTQMRMAVAGRGEFSSYDVNGRVYDSFTTLKRMGKAIISNPSGFGGFNQACITCDLSGTAPTVNVGQFKCTCDGPDYIQRAGPFGLLWGQNTRGASYTSPVVSPDGRLLYVGSAPYVYGIDTKAGNYIWQFQNPFKTDNFAYSNIAVGPDGTVYVGGSFSNHFFALDGLTGKMKWYYTSPHLDNYFVGKPAFNPIGTMVYVTSNGPVASVYAFNFVGDLLYNYTNDDLDNNTSVQSVAVGSDGSVYVSYSGYLLALNEGLTFKWSVVCGRINGTYNVDWYSPRIDSSGLIYVGSEPFSSKLYCFIDNGNSASLKWTYSAAVPSYVLSPVFGPDGQIYCASNSVSSVTPVTINNAGSLVSLSGDGVVKWKYNYLGVESGDIYNWIYPAVGSNGKIYVTNVNDSSLVILRDIGANFSYYKELSISDADSGVYGSLCLSPPVFGLGGLVFWCNGNNALPGIFGAGTTTITDTFDSASASVFRPNVRYAQPGEFQPLALPLPLSSELPFKMRIKMRA